MSQETHSLIQMAYPMATTTRTLTTEELRDIELRAHQLRAEAFNTLLRAGFRALITPFQKAVSRPTCARPLHG